MHHHKQKRSELTPTDHALETKERAGGSVDFRRELEELARHDNTESLAQLTGRKKERGLILILADKFLELEREVLNLKKELQNR